MLWLSFYLMCTVWSLVQKFFSLHLFIWLFVCTACRIQAILLQRMRWWITLGCILATNKNSDLLPSGNTSVSSTRHLKCVCVRRHCWYQESIAVLRTVRKMEGGSQTFLFSPLLCSPSCGHLSEGSFAFPTLHSTSIISCHCLTLQQRTLTPCPWYANLSPWCHFGAMMSGVGRHRGPSHLWALLLLLLLLCHSSPLPPALWMGCFSQWMDWVRV